MRLINQTDWCSKDLTRLIFRIAKDELNSGQMKSAQIKIVYRRANSRTIGRCTIGSPLCPRVNMLLLLPRTPDKLDMAELAHLIAHELGHAKGLNHKDMKNIRHGYVEGWREFYAWSLDPQWIPKFLPAMKPTIEEKKEQKRLADVAKAQAMVSKWITVHKRAETMLKKWRGKLRRSTAALDVQRTLRKHVSTIVLPVVPSLEVDIRVGSTLALVS